MFSTILIDILILTALHKRSIPLFDMLENMAFWQYNLGPTHFLKYHAKVEKDSISMQKLFHERFGLVFFSGDDQQQFCRQSFLTEVSTELSLLEESLLLLFCVNELRLV